VDDRDGYRDELAAAHARIVVLEAELETLRPKRAPVDELRAKRSALVAKQERSVDLTERAKRAAFVLAPMCVVALWLTGDLGAGLGLGAFLVFLGGVLPGRGAARTYEKGRLARLDEQIAHPQRAASPPQVRARVALDELPLDGDEEEHQAPFDGRRLPPP
jgi:hypothetical protein